MNAIDEGYPTDIIYLDYRKAFDSVPHERLLNKLEAYGIKGEIHRWIRNCLIGRTQRVIVNGEYSEAASVSSGIPQGSVLGPILFLIFINDLPEILQSIVKLFADDTKLYRTIVDKNDETILQNDIDQIAAWSERWQIPFNVNNCKVLKVGKNDQNVKYSMGTLEGRIELEQVQYEKYRPKILTTYTRKHYEGKLENRSYKKKFQVPKQNIIPDAIQKFGPSHSRIL